MQSWIYWFYLKNNALDQVQNYDYLGFTLDNTSSWNGHIKNVIRNLSHKIYIFAKIRQLLTTSASLILYKSMILPYFDYADIIYGSANKEKLEKLQRLQNKALKTALLVERRTNTNEIHNRAKLNKLSDRRMAHLWTYMFSRKFNNNYLDVRTIQSNTTGQP